MTKKLLLAEDSLIIRKVFELALHRSDISITMTGDGEEAIRLAEEIVPDLVVADVTLPGKNGYAVAQALRASGKTRHLPILILSGAIAPFDEKRFKECGADGVLFKPFEARELTERIDAMLRKPGAPPAVEDAAERSTPEEERWDFSDIVEEAGPHASGASAASRPSPPVEPLPGALLDSASAPPAPPFREFDVSVDEIEGGDGGGTAGIPASGPEPVVRVAHAESETPGGMDATEGEPSPLIEAIEEIEEIEPLEDVEIPSPTTGSVLPSSGESVRVVPPEIPPPPVESSPAEAPERTEASPPAGRGGPTVVEEPSAEPPGSPALAAVPPPGDDSGPSRDAIFESFRERTVEVFRSVAAEAVEKAVWEMTDRLAAEFSEKIREALETVAWEVIPRTAETLIREEIERIRAQTGKPAP